uniref:Transcriptional regulatory protein RXT2 N-terminal domain-containing protein n=1 Tax=Mycena chlorophos TaxID=658473 RepID=A0ABQ0LF67_MYCCL|nr:predicted protein [Mycena chlorophos]
MSTSKRRVEDTTPQIPIPLPLSDSAAWYYPSLGIADEDEYDDEQYDNRGNWGNKGKRSRWSRRGKMTSWGPGGGNGQEEEHARKRMRLLLPPETRSPSPPTLPHLDRASAPAFTAPYPPPNTIPQSFTECVLDKDVTHTFRSTLLDELEQSTNELVEGESTLRRALGRLWQVLREETDGGSAPVVVAKREDEDDEQDDVAKRLSRAPDLTPSAHKLFLSQPDGPPVYDPSHFATPLIQQDALDKSLATLRELQDDGREYTERLEEIREGLGDVRGQRTVVWNWLRTQAFQELGSQIADYE